ncbi:hypothetical protein OBBRIDRAFT_526755 [Obba rivulosa]|uniref:Nephrocystin 3-like N-terminal domain-containing protein n=1 Tax=Obba rivulosa TaxID=1052685 RepID=A0A8E2B096_9APHY|nr:hypothetical protein OBBRIDRAFT_526755 [Obba rivulosa]
MIQGRASGLQHVVFTSPSPRGRPLFLSYTQRTLQASPARMPFGKNKRGLHASQGFQSSVETQMPTKFNARKRESNDETVDAVLSIAKGAVSVAVDISSDIPVPGLNRALSVLGALLERIEKMRDNEEEAHDLIDSIESLRAVLNSSIARLSEQTKDLDPAQREAVRRTAAAPEGLNMRINRLLSDLEEIEDMIWELPKKHWWSKLMSTEQDAKQLRLMNRKIIAATNNFKLQGGIALERLVTEICGQLRQDGRDRISRANDETLNELRRSKDASYKSYYVEEKAKLQAGTRERILREITEWAAGHDQPHRIQVVHGPAGVGKSAIARSVSKQLANTPEVPGALDRRDVYIPCLLGASFFFQRAQAECNDPHLVFPTLAYQLAYSRKELLPYIADAVKKHLQHGASQAMEHQLRELIHDPLLQVPSGAITLPLALVVDGVDECVNIPTDVVPNMLQLLCQMTRELPFLRLLVFTRPETYIMDALPPPGNPDVIVRNLWEDAKDEINADIRIFVNAEFQTCTSKGRFTLLQERPDAVERLIQLAEGLFIYASTVVRFLVQDPLYAVVIYDKLLETQGSTGSPGLYDKLDLLYNTILRDAFGKFRADATRMGHIRQVLTWIVLSKEVISAQDLWLVGIPINITLDIVGRLRSVLIVPEDIKPDTDFKPCHASFPQFVVDSARCTDTGFLVEPQAGHTMIADCLLTLLACQDPHLVCTAPDSSLRWMWRYGNTHWTTHLLQSQYTDRLGRLLRAFARKHLELWLYSYPPFEGLRPGGGNRSDQLGSVQDWCKAHCGSDERLLKQLDKIISTRGERQSRSVNYGRRVVSNDIHVVENEGIRLNPENEDLEVDDATPT